MRRIIVSSLIVLSLSLCASHGGWMGSPGGAPLSEIDTQTVNASGNPVGIDTATRAVIGIDYSHHEIHDGRHYTCIYTNSLGDGISDVLLITTSNSTRWAHILYSFNGALDTFVEVYEGATNTAGAARLCVNNDRNSTNTALTSINDTTGSANGTKIFAVDFGTDAGLGVNKIAAGGSDRGDAEFILKQNEKYLIIISSRSAANKVSAKFTWYEHVNKTD